MSQIDNISSKQTVVPHDYQDKEVDNEGFFSSIEEQLPSILSSAEIWKQTRSELFELRQILTQMKKQKFIHGVIEWTAQEQKYFFKKVQNEVVDAGIMASAQIKQKFQSLIEDEIWREINDNGKKDYSIQDADGNTMLLNMGTYQQFLDTSFLFTKETSIIPLDLKLTVNKTETVENAKKILKKYDGKYNALVLVDIENHPIGIVKSNTLQKYEKTGNITLENIEFLSGISGYYTTSSDEVKEIMQEQGINILPIVDSNTQILIGILTSHSLIKKELQYYSATSLTKLSLEVGMKMNA